MGGFFKTGRAQPSQEQTNTGYGAFPSWLQDIFQNQYGKGINQYFNSPESLTPQGPMHQYQTQAANTYGQGIQGLQQDIGQYMNPYQQNVTDQINRRYNEQQNNLLGSAGQYGGLGALKSSSLGTQLSQNNMNRQNTLAGADVNNYNQALGLREQLLGNQMNAGNFLQGQAPNQFNRLQGLSQLLSMFPQTASGSRIGEIGEKPSRFQQVASGLETFNKLGSSYAKLAAGMGG